MQDTSQNKPIGYISVYLDRSILENFLREKVKGIPRDTKIHGIGYNGITDTFKILLSSAKFTGSPDHPPTYILKERKSVLSKSMELVSL